MIQFTSLAGLKAGWHLISFQIWLTCHCHTDVCLPDRWLDYKAVGKRLHGTRFIAFKVPLKQVGSSSLSLYILEHLEVSIKIVASAESESVFNSFYLIYSFSLSTACFHIRRSLVPGSCWTLWTKTTKSLAWSLTWPSPNATTKSR